MTGSCQINVNKRQVLGFNVRILLKQLNCTAYIHVNIKHFNKLKIQHHKKLIQLSKFSVINSELNSED